MMKHTFFMVLLSLLGTLTLSAQYISEFEPNPTGDPDPAMQSVELAGGTPSAAFDLWLVSIENDGANGLVDRAANVTGTFDANGFAVVSIPDLENPSFTLILTDAFTGTVGTTDIDTDDDGTPETLTDLGTILDAVGVSDMASDDATMYGDDLGGTNILNNGAEPSLAFYDATNMTWYAYNGTDVFDETGAVVIAVDFDLDPTVSTFGSTNPVYDNTPTTVVEFEFTSYTVDEDGVSLDVCVTIANADATNPTTVDVAATGGTADAPDDYTLSTTSLTFPAGDGTPQCVTINVVDDALEETGGETVELTLSNPMGGSSAILGANTMATVTITDNDSTAEPSEDCDLVITAVFDGPLSGGVPKGVELFVVNDIDDLSSFGLSSVTNGAGPTGTPEYTFPADAATAGSYIYVASESTGFTSFFGFAPNYTSGAMSINGDDAIELFHNGVVTDVFGDVNVDGTSQTWEYMDGWAYRNNDAAPSPTFDDTQWAYSGPNALDGETTNATAATPVPIGTFTTTAQGQGCGAPGCQADVTLTGSITDQQASASITINPLADGTETATLSGTTTLDAPMVTINGDFDTSDGAGGSYELNILQAGCTPLSGENTNE